VVEIYLHDPTYLFTLHTLKSIFCSSSMYDKYDGCPESIQPF
jgi:hypothetical protein